MTTLTSNDTQIVGFDFHSAVITTADEDQRKAIVAQRLYTIGALAFEHEAIGWWSSLERGQPLPASTGRGPKTASTTAAAD